MIMDLQLSDVQETDLIPLVIRADKKTVQSEQNGRNGTDKQQVFWYAGLRNVGKAAFFNQHRLV